MQLVVIANDDLRKELLSNDMGHWPVIEWVHAIDDCLNYPHADGFIDLLFEPTFERIVTLGNISGAPVIVNSVITTLHEMNADFVRINAWPGFLQRSLIEASCHDEEKRLEAEEIFACFNKKVKWVDDLAGFISPRVISTIINEAWFALGEKISTKEEIDLAMKLGTNYPYGPFEWCDKIGTKNIYGLLDALCKTDIRYTPAGLLEKEANA